MMTQQLEVSILAAPLAAIDRRALSQAWYSALHLARQDRCLLSARERAPRVAKPNEPKPQGVADPRRPRAAEPRAQRSMQTNPLPVTMQSGAGRISVSRGSVPLSQRIERRFAHSTPQVRRATFSMGRGAARVHVILQTNGNVATLVALCRPQMRGVVARALAQARFALAKRGVLLDYETRGKQCS
ncbi:MAG: hypothetical protein WAK11_08365 [Candidatus Cybelea sp.]